MFGLQLNEVIVTLIIALIIFGPQRLPEIARGLGKAIREFRETSSQVTEEFRRATDLNAPPDPVPGTVAHIDPAPVSEASIQAPIGMAAATIAASEESTAPISEASMRAETTDVPLPSEQIIYSVPMPETTTLVSDTSPVAETTALGTVEPGEATTVMSDAPGLTETTTVGTVAPGEATSLMSDAPGLTDTAPAGTLEPSSEVSEPIIQAAPQTSMPQRAEKDVTDTDHAKSPPSP